MDSNNTTVVHKCNTQVVCDFNTEVIDCLPMSISYGERLRAARENKKLTQPQLSELSGVPQGTISKIERGDQGTSSYDAELSFHLNVHVMWLKHGDRRFVPDWLGGTYATSDYIDGEVIRRALPGIESNAYIEGDFDLWDESTPLNDDDVALSFYKEVEVSAGSGRTEVIENGGRKLRFAKSTLQREGVLEENAACVTVSGNSMEPVLMDGTTIGIDKSVTRIVDGEMYAIDHDGHLRVKLLYRMPGGGVRIRSYNSEEYPDEKLTAEEAKSVRVIGWVFWHSTLRKKRF